MRQPDVMTMPVVITLLEDTIVPATLDMRVMDLKETAVVSSSQSVHNYMD